MTGTTKMGTKIKIAYSEAQKWVTAQTEVSSDELNREELMALAKSVAEEAQRESAVMTMRKQ